MPNPTKTYYRIREVAVILDIPASTLRYWESVFPMLTPERTPAGQRRFSAEQLETARRIKQLLYEKGMKIDAAAELLERSYRKLPPRRPFTCNSSADALRLLQDVKRSLEDVRALAKVEAVAGWIEAKSARRKGKKGDSTAN